LRIIFSLILSFSFLSANSQGGNYFSPGGSHSLADYYRRQELITGKPSQLPFSSKTTCSSFSK